MYNLAAVRAAVSLMYGMSFAGVWGQDGVYPAAVTLEPWPVLMELGSTHMCGGKSRPFPGILWSWFSRVSVCCHSPRSHWGTVGPAQPLLSPLELSSPSHWNPRVQLHSLLCLFWHFLLRGLQVYPSMSVSVTKPHVFKVPLPWSCDWTVPRLLPVESSRLSSGWALTRASVAA